MTHTPAPARSARPFGMVFPDAHPIVMPDEYAKRVHMFDIPASLREHACTVLDTLSGGVWWSIGEFRYAGDMDFTTATARRVLVNGRMAVQYAIEDCD